MPSIEPEVSARLVRVAAGAITDADGRVLVARRPEHAHQGGLWEFPGGKIEPGESPTAALRRELDEELGIRVLAAEPLIRIPYDYGDRRVLLEVLEVKRFAGQPHGREGQPLRWVHPQRMDPVLFPAADVPVIRALRLPPLLLITGGDPLRPGQFLGRLRSSLAAGVRLVQLRAPALSDRERYRELATAAWSLCRRCDARLVLNAPAAVRTGLEADGIHLTSGELLTTDRRPPADRYGIVGASCHDAHELACAAALGLDYALLSPVKTTASHPRAASLGWERFAELVERAAVPVYALGGVGRADLAQARRRGAQGVAAIRGLWPHV